MSLAGEPRVRGAVVRRLREPLLGEVDGDDPLGAGQPAADHRPEADEAAAEHGTGRAGLHARGVDGGADARREPARERRAAFERRLRAHLGERDLRHHRVLREGRRAHEVAERVTVPAEPGRAVGEVAEPLLVPDRDAAVRARAQAVDALPALRCEQRHHVVAGRDERHAVAHALDDACALVPEHARRVAGRIGARRRVEVGVADAARDEPDERLARLRLGQLDVLDDERLSELLENGGADLHPPILLSRTGGARARACPRLRARRRSRARPAGPPTTSRAMRSRRGRRA